MAVKAGMLLTIAFLLRETCGLPSHVLRATCPQLLQPLIGQSDASMLSICLHNALPRSSCEAAHSALGGQPLSQPSVMLVCTALVQEDNLDESQHILSALGLRAGMVSRQGHLDASLQRKPASERDAAYLVREYEPQAHPTVSAFSKDSSDAPPPAAVDLTIPLPPDANGDPFDTPADGWSENTQASGTSAASGTSGT